LLWLQVPVTGATLRVRKAMGDKGDSSPTWTAWADILRVCAYPPHLKRTAIIALIAGTILFTINDLDLVLSGSATAGVWLKIGLTYIVPFCVSNYGILVANHRRVAAP